MCHPILNLKKPPKTRKPLFFFFSFFSLSIKEEEEMEAILVDCVNCKPQSSPFHASKRHIHVRTALRRVPFRGTQMAQSRYLIAISCFQMDLLNEVEAALCPTNEPGLEGCHTNEVPRNPISRDPTFTKNHVVAF
ncbi:cell division cycle protein 27 homolog B isoform X2 [Populus trichocarpa]|nr:cell division cycle protein 27 homolog B isoform X2 [Populus trichocarpa]